MKRTLAAAACMLTIIAAFTGCNTRDGKVNDNSSAAVVSRTNEADRLTASERSAVEGNDSAASAVNRDVVVENNNTYNDNYDRNHDRNPDDDSLIGDIGNTVGNGINDVTNGVENLCDTVASGIEDMTNNTDTVNY